jgi:cytosine permease
MRRGRQGVGYLKEEKTVTKESKIEKITLNVVPQEKRKSWLDVSLIQAGVYICVPDLLLGGMLISSMSMKNAIIAGAIGYLISIVITAFDGIIGEDLGVPTCVVGLASFGKKGARIILSTLFAFSMIGWFSAQNGVCGQAFTTMMSKMGIHIPVTVSICIWGIIMLLTAVYGIDGLKVLNWIAVPALALIFIVGTVIAVDKYGTAALASSGDESMSILGGIVLTVSFISVGMTCASDFTRYQKSRGGVWTSSFLGIWIPGMVLCVLGAILTKLTGQNDLSQILADIGFPILGAIILILATWTTNTTNAYSAGINFVMLFHLKDDKRAITTIISGVIGTLLAMFGFDSYFETFVNLLGTFFMPCAGVFLADYWITRKGDPKKYAYSDGFQPSGIIAWACGCAVTYYFENWGLFLGFFVSILLYLILKKLIPGNEVHVIDPDQEIEL